MLLIQVPPRSQDDLGIKEKEKKKVIMKMIKSHERTEERKKI